MVVKKKKKKKKNLSYNTQPYSAIDTQGYLQIFYRIIPQEYVWSDLYLGYNVAVLLNKSHDVFF